MHTVHTIMAKIAKLRIHIAPVGYEIDRIVIPAKQERADKVWLLVHENKSDDKAVPFVSKITKQLEKLRIEVVQESHDRRDLFKIIRVVKNIIEQEKDTITTTRSPLTHTDGQRAVPASIVPRLIPTTTTSS